MATRRLVPHEKDGNHGSRHAAFAERQASLKNQQAREHRFLQPMLDDTYYPRPLVEQGVGILVDLCAQFEVQKPTTPDAAYALTHAATEAFNTLQDSFFEADSEIETVARETIAEDFGRILDWYGHEGLELEAAIAPRAW
jgi:hypothetical protein